MSALKRLSERRVFNVYRLDSGAFRIIEACDQYFWLDLSAEEMRALAAELLAFIDDQTIPTMEEGERAFAEAVARRVAEARAQMEAQKQRTDPTREARI